MQAARKLALVALFAIVGACSPQMPKADAPPAPKAAATVDPGWMDADAPGMVSIVYRETNGAQDFALTCLLAGKTLRVEGAMPLAPPPQAGERATLQLGPVEVKGVVRIASESAEDARVTLETPLTPQLLVAIGDAKTARLAYRDNAADTGVDENGKLPAFVQRCAQLTNITPAL